MQNTFGIARTDREGENKEADTLGTGAGNGKADEEADGRGENMDGRGGGTTDKTMTGTSREGNGHWGQGRMAGKARGSPITGGKGRGGRHGQNKDRGQENLGVGTTTRPAARAGREREGRKGQGGGRATQN